ncbi:hypothetical protein BJ742DRAFT_439862 [Cladochytrium replicatum]|nr:hypothetical protein BJ742DRAFT_439862 [Cladochytrium replicatum]
MYRQPLLDKARSVLKARHQLRKEREAERTARMLTTVQKGAKRVHGDWITVAATTSGAIGVQSKPRLHSTPNGPAVAQIGASKMHRTSDNGDVLNTRPGKQPSSAPNSSVIRTTQSANVIRNTGSKFGVPSVRRVKPRGISNASSNTSVETMLIHESEDEEDEDDEEMIHDEDGGSEEGSVVVHVEEEMKPVIIQQFASGVTMKGPRTEVQSDRPPSLSDSDSSMVVHDDEPDSKVVLSSSAFGTQNRRRPTSLIVPPVGILEAESILIDVGSNERRGVHRSISANSLLEGVAQGKSRTLSRSKGDVNEYKKSIRQPLALFFGSQDGQRSTDTARKGPRRTSAESGSGLSDWFSFNTRRKSEGEGSDDSNIKSSGPNSRRGSGKVQQQNPQQLFSLFLNAPQSSGSELIRRKWSNESMSRSTVPRGSSDGSGGPRIKIDDSAEFDEVPRRPSFMNLFDSSSRRRGNSDSAESLPAGIMDSNAHVGLVSTHPAVSMQVGDEMVVAVDKSLPSLPRNAYQPIISGQYPSINVSSSHDNQVGGSPQDPIGQGVAERLRARLDRFRKQMSNGFRWHREEGQFSPYESDSGEEGEASMSEQGLVARGFVFSNSKGKANARRASLRQPKGAAKVPGAVRLLPRWKAEESSQPVPKPSSVPLVFGLPQNGLSPSRDNEDVYGVEDASRYVDEEETMIMRGRLPHHIPGVITHTSVKPDDDSDMGAMQSAPELGDNPLTSVDDQPATTIWHFAQTAPASPMLKSPLGVTPSLGRRLSKKRPIIPAVYSYLFGIRAAEEDGGMESVDAMGHHQERQFYHPERSNVGPSHRNRSETQWTGVSSSSGYDGPATRTSRGNSGSTAPNTPSLRRRTLHSERSVEDTGSLGEDVRHNVVHSTISHERVRATYQRLLVSAKKDRIPEGLPPDVSMYGPASSSSQPSAGDGELDPFAEAFIMNLIREELEKKSNHATEVESEGGSMREAHDQRRSRKSSVASGASSISKGRSPVSFSSYAAATSGVRF